MRLQHPVTLAALLMTAAGCNALSGVDDFQFVGSGAGGAGQGGAGAGAGGAGSGAGGPGGAGGGAGGGSGTVQTAVLGPGLGLDLGNELTYDGSLGTMKCLTLSIPDQGMAGVGEVEVKVGMVHSWLSDLVMKVASPQGTVTTLMSRVGIEEAADSYAELNGSGANLAVTHPITFRDGAAVPAESMGATLDSAGVICRDDGICDFVPSPGKGPGTSLADFQGEPPAGDWQVCIVDADDTELGAVDQVQISVLSW